MFWYLAGAGIVVWFHQTSDFPYLQLFTLALCFFFIIFFFFCSRRASSLALPQKKKINKTDVLKSLKETAI